MSVLIKNKRWTSSRIPYHIKDKVSQIEPWLLEINTCLEYDLMVRKKSDDSNYIEVDSGAGRSETIGMKGGAQTITALEKFAMQHELLHALGFYHEQYHIEFPWDDSQPPRQVMKNTARMSMYEYESLQGWNAAVFEQLKILGGTAAPDRVDQATVLLLANDSLTPEKKAQLGGRRYANGQLNSRFIYTHDPNIESWGFCDFDSVMMYSECRNAILAVLGAQGHPAPPADRNAMQRSGMKAEYLSNQDIAAIKYMYPRG